MPSPVSEAPVAPGAGGLFGSGLSDALEPQRVRLTDALKGTPVVVEALPDRRLRVAVPLRYAFDTGKSAIKPALAAVLDQLAIGFKPYAATSELRIAAPTDVAGTAKPVATERLVQDRGASVRDYPVGRGVPISRVPGLGRNAAETASLDIILSDRVN